MLGNTYKPVSVLMVARVWLVSWFCNVTLTPGITAPELSRMTPLTSPREVCANAFCSRHSKQRNVSTRTDKRAFLLISPPFTRQRQFPQAFLAPAILHSVPIGLSRSAVVGSN